MGIIEKMRLDGKKGFITGAARGIGKCTATAFAEAGADIFGVGSYIAHAVPMDMTMDLKEVDGVPVAKRGRLPGILDNPRLVEIK